MYTELRKRLEEAASKELKCDSCKNKLGLGLCTFCCAPYRKFLKGTEHGYKEAIAHAKEWWKQGSVWLDLMSVKDSNDLGDLINTFETEMNKLLEGER